MNQLLETLSAKHRAWVESHDPVEQSREAAPGGAAEARLRRSRVLLVAGGAVGLHAALSLSRLPLGLLTLFPMGEADAEPLARVTRQRPHNAREVNKTPKVFRAHNLALYADRYSLVAFAVERPHPDAFEGVNEACVRLGAAWTSVVVWGAEVTLGPTVLPGATACYNCYLRRRFSNTPRPEAWQAREQFLRNDPAFAFKGRIAPLVGIASALLTAEVRRFLTNDPEPLALGREVLYDALTQTQTSSFVVPLEGCPVCSRLWPEGSRADESFVRMVRRAARPSEVTSHAGE
jgi:bacteriocin biosynthesis cyclodehydratase domain-containing protein